MEDANCMHGTRGVGKGLGAGTEFQLRFTGANQVLVGPENLWSQVFRTSVRNRRAYCSTNAK